MARLSRSLPCPACGEAMKVARGPVSHKVCCPHCRQNVTVESEIAEVTPFPKLADDLTVSTASLQLEEILTRCKEQRSLIEAAEREIAHLEARATALSRWLPNQELASDEVRSTRALVDLQARLFEQLQPLARGRIAVRECCINEEKSLASHVRLTFEAFGWDVQFERGEEISDYGEEITFVVAPGPVNYSVAAVYIALQSAGIRLRSQVDLAQSPDEALLWVHQISKLPKLLPPPRNVAISPPIEEYRKTA